MLEVKRRKCYLRETYNREYDQQGNWIKEIKSHWKYQSDGLLLEELERAIFRDITYYSKQI